MENRTDNKLKSVARKLEDIIPNGSAQTVYDNLQQVMRGQRDYFETYSAVSMLKLTLYIYSLKKTKNFDLADSIMDDLFFASLFATNNNIHKEECDYCYGSGQNNCDECDGSGRIMCGTCDGEGEETCETCDGGEMMDCQTCGGSGEDEEGESCGNCGGEGLEKCDDCDGKGITTCYNCAGDGEVDCSNCSGYGSESCHNCDGVGEIETDKIEYDVYEICSWDSDLYNILELKLDEEKPAISDENFTKFNKSVIILNQTGANDEFNIELVEDAYYCFGLDKKDEINLSSDLSLNRRKFSLSLNHYIGNYTV
jgi:hypothetical protein